MTSNQTPATCLTDGHCISPDDTTDTCMRCGKIVRVEYKNEMPDQSALAGWIPHTGNECPVPGDTIIRIKQRNGFDDYETRAGDFKACWDVDPQKPDDCNITHYRIVTPANHPALGLEPLNIKATVTDEFGTYPYEYWQKKHAKPNEPAYGKTLRDEMAMAALTGMLSNKDWPHCCFAAEQAYKYADQMMKKRSTPTEGE